MTHDVSAYWYRANQSHLMAALDVVRTRLDAADRAGAGGPEPPSLDEPLARLRRARESMPSQPALERLCTKFGLSAFESDVLLMCAGMELDASFRASHAPTFGLALALLSEPHWSATPPGAPLRAFRMVELDGDSLTASRLRIDERVLHYLCGVECIDERLAGYCSRGPLAEDLPPSHGRLAEELAEYWRGAGDRQDYGLVQACSIDREMANQVLAAACRLVGLGPWVLRASEIPANSAEREDLKRLWRREAILENRALIIEVDVEGDERARSGLRAFATLEDGIVMLNTRTPVSDCGVRRRIDVLNPTPGEQRDLWSRTLGPLTERLEGEIDRVVMQFDLSSRRIQGAAEEARRAAADGAASNGSSPLWRACRSQSRPRLGDLAQYVRPQARWDDLVLPESQKEALRDIAKHVRHRAQVYDRWGFATGGARSLGISALFSGASGTGKTMAAEVLANELELDLYRVDLSAVVSKYIGETEKNLRQVFDAAEDGGAILLFDEADALFGRRSEVKDSHDRYANLEISYLLQRMESYRGLAILTTNMKQSLDTAFMRRLRFVVNFPFPVAELRARIWDGVFPSQAELGAVDVSRLARLNLSGGHIRNIALNAAFLAADESRPLDMDHLYRAARSEYAKLERALTDVEFGKAR